MSAADGFEAWGRFVVRRRWFFVVAPLIFAGICAFRLPDLVVDNSVESFLRRDDPEVIAYREFQELFGRNDLILVVAEGPRVFDADFLRRLWRLHRDLESGLPYVDEVTSLVNARYTHGEADVLVVEDLMPSPPEGQSAVEALERRLRSIPVYEDVLVSRDGTLTALAIKPLTSPLEPGDGLGGFADAAPVEGGRDADQLSAGQFAELIDSVDAVLARHEGPGFSLRLAGGPVINHRISLIMAQDLKRLMPVSIGASALVLLLLFRRVTAVWAPLAVVSVTCLSTFGIMAALGIPGSLSIQILPAFLVTVAICDAIHILVIAFQRLAAGSDREEAILHALRHSGVAITMTSLTTAAGLLSFATAPVAPVYHLGIVGPIGVMLALLFTLTLFPALLALLPLRGEEFRSPRGAQVGVLLARVGELPSGHPRAVLAVWALLALVGFAGALRVQFSHDPMRWFPADDPLKEVSQVIDHKLRGAGTLEAVVDTGSPGGLYEPETLRRIEKALDFAGSYRNGPIFVGKTVSLVDLIKETHRALNENRDAFYALPRDRETVAQEMLLFESAGAEHLEELVDGEFRRARLSLRVPIADGILYLKALDDIEEGFREALGPENEVRMTGTSVLLTRGFGAVIVSLTRSYAFALIAITPMMILVLRSVRVGLASMIPNLMPVLLTVGLMGCLGIPLDAATLVVGAIVIGLAVDDTIHFMHKFQGHLELSGDPRQAIRQTLESTGAAMLCTSVVLASGFFVFTLAGMRGLVEYGLLAGTATVIAFAADLFIGPALMTLLYARRVPTPARDEAGVAEAPVGLDR